MLNYKQWLVEEYNMVLLVIVVAADTSDSEDTQTYIGPVYFHHSCIGVYKRNLTENLLL